MKTYGNWLNEWYKVYKKPYIKTHKNIERNIRLHIPKYVKDMKLECIDVVQIQKAINNITCSRTRLYVYDIYHATLKLGYMLELIKKDYSLCLIKPKHERKKGTALTNVEIETLLNNIKGTTLQYYYEFLLYSGVRRNEALTLRWCDIDFKNSLIHIKGTKTISSDRYIPLFPNLYGILDNLLYYRDISRYSNTFVFPFTCDYVSHEFKKYCPTHKLHDLRHTFATKCLESGINAKTVQLWLGHSSFNVTMDIYSHVMSDFQQNEIDKLKF